MSAKINNSIERQMVSAASSGKLSIMKPATQGGASDVATEKAAKCVLPLLLAFPPPSSHCRVLTALWVFQRQGRCCQTGKDGHQAAKDQPPRAGQPLGSTPPHLTLPHPSSLLFDDSFSLALSLFTFFSARNDQLAPSIYQERPNLGPDPLPPAPPKPSSSTRSSTPPPQDSHLLARHPEADNPHSPSFHTLVDLLLMVGRLPKTNIPQTQHLSLDSSSQTSFRSWTYTYTV